MDARGAAGRSATLLARARHVREHAATLKSRSAVDCGQAERLLEQTVASLRRAPVVFGTDDGGWSLHLPRSPVVIGLVRDQLTHWLADTGVCAEDAFAITLACSEACANAIEHPLLPQRQAFDVGARRTGRAIELRVRDYGDWDESASSAARGRGLRMIEELMDAAEIRSANPGAELRMRREI